MWRPLLPPDSLLPGVRLKKELMLGNGDTLWTEYELLETNETGVLLKPLQSCGHPYPDDPARYKKMSYEFLHSGGTKIWDTEFGKFGWLQYRYKKKA